MREITHPGIGVQLQSVDRGEGVGDVVELLSNLYKRYILMREGNEGHLSLKFPWMSQPAGVKEMLIFNTKIYTVFPGSLQQGLTCLNIATVAGGTHLQVHTYSYCYWPIITT